MTQKEKKESIGRRLVSGQVLSGEMFARYWVQIILLLAMVLIYITNRYSCQRSMEEVRRLQTRLEVVQSESMRIRGHYMSRIRESAMRQMLDSVHPDLDVQPEPPYHLSYPHK